MKILLRIILIFLSVTISLNVIGGVLYSLSPEVYDNKLIPSIIFLFIGIFIVIFIWKKTKNISDNMAKYILLSGLVIGGIGFLLGFFGGPILYPTSNLSPLLGFFITGPLGLVLGGIGGGIYWRYKVKGVRH